MSFYSFSGLVSFVSGAFVQSCWRRWVQGSFWFHFLNRPVVIVTGADAAALTNPPNLPEMDVLSRDVQRALSNIEVNIFRRGGRLADWQERGWRVPEAAAVNTSLVLIGGPDENDATAALMDLFGVTRSDIGEGSAAPGHRSHGSVMYLCAPKSHAAVLVIMGDSADGATLATRWLEKEGFKRERSVSFVHRVHCSDVGEPVLSHRRALPVAEWA